MNRAPFVVAVLGLSSTAAVAAPLHMVHPALGSELEARVGQLAMVQSVAPSLSCLGDTFAALVPRAAFDEIVRWQRDLRDILHDGIKQLAILAETNGVRLPDLTPLLLDPVANTESSGFGWRDDPFRHRARYHSGADFRGKRGTPVLASGDGIVVFSGRRGGYGNAIDIDHGGGVVTRYAHLQKIDAKKDAVVAAGEQIGLLGSTGRATGPHLHFEVRLDGRPVDPVMAMMIATLEREDPMLGRVASFALSPELQSEVSSRVDPPRTETTQKSKQKETRPERAGRSKRVKPLS